MDQPDVPHTMRAMVLTGHGGPEALELRRGWDTEPPVPARCWCGWPRRRSTTPICGPARAPTAAAPTTPTPARAGAARSTSPASRAATWQARWSPSAPGPRVTCSGSGCSSTRRHYDHPGPTPTPSTSSAASATAASPSSSSSTPRGPTRSTTPRSATSSWPRCRSPTARRWACSSAGAPRPARRSWSPAPPAASAWRPCSWPRPAAPGSWPITSGVHADAVRRAGAHVTVDRTEGDLRESLAAACPEGIDVVVDVVAGPFVAQAPGPAARRCALGRRRGARAATGSSSTYAASTCQRRPGRLDHAHAGPLRDARRPGPPRRRASGRGPHLRPRRPRHRPGRPRGTRSRRQAGRHALIDRSRDVWHLGTRRRPGPVVRAFSLCSGGRI